MTILVIGNVVLSKLFVKKCATPAEAQRLAKKLRSLS